jgi:hypothetical protein
MMKLVKYEVDEEQLLMYVHLIPIILLYIIIQSKLRESFYGEDNIIDC